ncbi:helix-turn-helix domain-containing protein [Actinosynnema sp. NPDC050436]|uniref:helix-turn-helix domain-containing protein n=1 Tax=Actinosynnema sp. NPDC050436 TaxID=3155659 RepID=UPI0034068F54
MSPPRRVAGRPHRPTREPGRPEPEATTTPAAEPETVPDKEPRDDQENAHSRLVSADDDTHPLLYTPDQAARLLQVRPSWLRRRAAARAIPCRLLGKHLRFAHQDLLDIAAAALRPPPSTPDT